MTSRARFVFDTNAIVSALLLNQSVARRAFDAALTEGEILLSTALLNELNEVLSRDKFDKYLTRAERFRFLAALVKAAVLIEPEETIQECRDPRDDMVLELAVSGGASAIVSGDLDLLTLSPFRGIDILSPGVFLERRHS